MFENFKKVGEGPIDFGRKAEVVDTKIYYFDALGFATDKEHACSANIVEYDKDGNIVNEVFGTCSPQIDEDNNAKRR